MLTDDKMERCLCLEIRYNCVCVDCDGAIISNNPSALYTVDAPHRPYPSLNLSSARRPNNGKPPPRLSRLPGVLCSNNPTAVRLLGSLARSGVLDHAWEAPRKAAQDEQRGPYTEAGDLNERVVMKKRRMMAELTVLVLRERVEWEPERSMYAYESASHIAGRRFRDGARVRGSGGMPGL